MRTILIPEAKEIFLYYGAAVALALLFFLRRRPRAGMRLKLRGQTEAQKAVPPPIELFSHIQLPGERPLNVVFNYNGHSWDAYEVLGLPAGSSPDKVGLAYQLALNGVDVESRPFLAAAFAAIQREWVVFRAAGDR